MTVFAPRRLVGLALGLALLPAAHAAGPEQPSDYAQRWPLTVAQGASLLRLPLPAEVLTRLQTTDGRDLRIFNADGQPVAFAVDRATDAPPNPPAPTPWLPALPILGAAPGTQGQAAGAKGLALRIEERPEGTRVLQLDVPAASGTAPAAAGSALTQRVLLDARALQLSAQALDLDVSIPEGYPVTLRAQASRDLQQWQTLGDVTVYRFGAQPVAPARIAIPPTALNNLYLQVDWQAPDAPPGAVQVRGATVIAAAIRAAAPRLPTPLALPAQASPNPHAFEWRLPFATPLQALDIRAAQASAVVPVRLLARQHNRQPWTPVASHVVFSLQTEDGWRHSPPVELGGASWREWRMEASAQTPGFVQPPQLTAWLAPIQLVFVASGPAPYTLTAGRPDAAAANLPLPSLIPGYESGAQNRLPVASLQAAASASNADLQTSAPVMTSAAAPEQPPWRNLLLWAVLAVGVLALLGMAWALMRQVNQAAPPDKPAPSIRQ